MLRVFLALLSMLWLLGGTPALGVPGGDNDSPYNCPSRLRDLFRTDKDFTQPVGITTAGGHFATAYHGAMVFTYGPILYVADAFNAWSNVVDGEAAAGEKPAELVNQWTSNHQVVVVRTYKGTNETARAHVRRHIEYVDLMKEAFPPDQTVGILDVRVLKFPLGDSTPDQLVLAPNDRGVILKFPGLLDPCVVPRKVA